MKKEPGKRVSFVYKTMCLEGVNEGRSKKKQNTKKNVHKKRKLTEKGIKMDQVIIFLNERNFL